MARIGASFARAECVVVMAPTPNTPVRADAASYKVAGAFTVGGIGEIAPPELIRPHRPWASDDTEIIKPAEVGDPCTLCIDPQGRKKLVMLTEVFGETDCTQP